MFLRRGLAIAVALGLALGLVTQLAQSLLPAGVGQLANSISPWLTVAYFVGAVQSRSRNAAAAGFVTLALALVGYYAMVFLRFGYTGGRLSLLVWSIGSIAGSTRWDRWPDRPLRRLGSTDTCAPTRSPSWTGEISRV